MAGLISTQISEDDPLSSIQGYDPELSEVNAPTDTVSGQMETLLAKESPYITRARTSAAQYANSRGLLNSSIGAEAGESAAIGAALPIASQDANIFNTTRLTNQAAKNRGFEFTAGSTNAAAGQAFAGKQALEQIGAQGEQTRLNIGSQAAAETGLIGIRTAAQVQLLQQEFANQSELNVQQFAQQKAQTILQGEIQQGLITTEAQARERLATLQGQIESTLSAQQYQQALGTAAFAEQAQARLATLQNGLNEQMAQLQANLQAGTIMQKDYEIRSQLLAQQQQAQMATMERQALLNQQMEQLQANLQTGQIMPAEFEQQKALLQQQFQQTLTLQQAQQDFGLALQQMKGDQANQLAAVESSYRTLIQTSASASQFFTNMTSNIGAILSDATTSDEQKTAAVTQMTTMLEAGLTVIGGIGNVDLQGLLDFAA